ncbi:UPF0280 family protein [Roseobacter sinensis]|uniref:UPF0280 family protein n=1 Tax=Roseobacter sinensis TaxID=2931391 RepID=A0ABT3BJ28_9RHOB|nr:UPF0280 family protein [Roseobacter sp. WL0113]MCV3273581.1 UPF0280 family protein [Roseobacter sp. WL0113]
MTAQARLLPGGTRLHLQHGPIDLIIGADAPARQRAFAAARARFAGLLEQLVSELPSLRRAIGAGHPRLSGVVAQRMVRAVHPFQDRFVTPMAAVAGAVADEVLAAMRCSGPLRRAYVNNGGDVALHLAPGERFITAMQGVDGTDLGRISLSAGQGIGGIATSGRHGRSLSLGIADSVTVLAESAAAADAAATLIANAVDLPGHPGISRTAAHLLDTDSDLGARAVVTGCAPLSRADCSAALQNGLHEAKRMATAGLIRAASLHLQGQTTVLDTDKSFNNRILDHA